LTGNANELGLQLTLGACMIWLFPKRAGAIGCSFAFVVAAYAASETRRGAPIMDVAIAKYRFKECNYAKH
jgi:hypothetical protein